MRSAKLFLSLLLVLVLGVSFGVSLAGAVPDGSSGWVCPMDEHAGQVHAAEGTCPRCGMPLIAKAAFDRQMAARRDVAILLFEGVQIIDYTGPYEVFGQARTAAGPAFRIFTVAEKAGPLQTNMGMTVVPRYTFADAPKADILIVPGGGVPPHLENPAVLSWVRESSKNAEVVLSVCNGAFFLARTGLLDGLEATTFAGLIDALREAAPKTRIVSDRRFVDNGKIVTTAGLSSGIDGSLHVIGKLLGKGHAQRIALNMEYNWQPELNWARAALPDRLVQVDLPGGLSNGAPLLTQGTADHWEKQWSIATDRSVDDVRRQVEETLATANRWTRRPATDPGASAWTFTDEQGRHWNGLAAVEPLEPGKLKLTMKINRG